MDPIIKALHETWKTIVTEGKSVTYIDPKTGEEKHEILTGGMKDPYHDVEPDGKGGYRPKREEPDYDVGVEKGPDGKWNYVKKPKTKTGYRIDPNLFDLIKPKPTPGYEKYVTPDYLKFPRPVKKTAVDRSLPDYIQEPRYIQDAGPGEYKTQPIISTRTPAPQPAAPATTGSGLLNSVLNTNKKMYNSVTGSLPSMPKIYEERDAEGQMAMGELKVLAQKAQELAGMMKDDTQLEAWVQSKITKAKDYISSVHDYMNGNPDKID